MEMLDSPVRRESPVVASAARRAARRPAVPLADHRRPGGRPAYDRGEGLLVNAIRDPAVLDAVDHALFDGQDAECVYETTGVQIQTLRAYARPLGLALDGRKQALLVFRDETELRQVERTRVDFLA